MRPVTRDRKAFMYNPLLMEKTMRRTLIILTLLAASGIALAKPVAETAAPLLLKPTADQTEAAIWAMRFLSRFHYKPMPLDDAMSEKIFKSYVESLDAEHLFFTQADMDRFAEARDKLDDAIFERDLSAPFAMFNLYEQRVAERLEHARELLAKPFDFTKDESYELDRSKAAWAANSTELDELWRKRVKNDWLRLKLAGKADKDIRETLDKRYANYLDRIRELFDDLERKRDIAHFLDLTEGGDGVRIFIGSENKLFSLSGSQRRLRPRRPRAQSRRNPGLAE